MSYNDILKSLAVRHGVILSKRHFIRMLKLHGYRRRQYDDLGDVIDFIIMDVHGWSGCLRQLHSPFRKQS